MRIKRADYLKSAVYEKDYPERLNSVEFAFVGRSNVGKSSLINTLIQRKSLARTSSTPGKTQTMNFYNINNEFCLVDLPGYGYAHVKTEFRRAWGPMIEKYLRDSVDLRAVFLLLDIRRTPNDDDSLMYECKKEGGNVFKFY